MLVITALHIAASTIAYSTDGTATPGFNSGIAVSLGTSPASSQIFTSAQQFIASNTVTLNSIVVPLSAPGNNESFETFELLTDASGIPGSVLDTITVNGITSTPTLLTGLSTSHPLIIAGTSYWLYGMAGAVQPGFTSSNVEWFGANPLLLNGLRASLTNGSLPWQVTSSGAKEGMALLGDTVVVAPEPATLFLSGFAFVFVIIGNRCRSTRG